MQQLTLHLEDSLNTYRDLRECFAACVYRVGLKRVAAECDVQPSHLSEALSGARKLDVEVVERYVAAFDDPTPVLYMASRYLRDPVARQQAAVAQLATVMQQLGPLMEAAGLGVKLPKARRT